MRYPQASLLITASQRRQTPPIVQPVNTEIATEQQTTLQLDVKNDIIHLRINACQFQPYFPINNRVSILNIPRVDSQTEINCAPHLKHNVKIRQQHRPQYASARLDIFAVTHQTYFQHQRLLNFLSFHPCAHCSEDHRTVEQEQHRRGGVPCCFCQRS